MIIFQCHIPTPSTVSIFISYIYVVVLMLIGFRLGKALTESEEEHDGSDEQKDD
jgi:hypothetical protein